MSLINNLFNPRREELHEDWKRLEKIQQIEEIDLKSSEKTIVLFKHSTSCGISAMSKFQLEREWSFFPDELDFYYLDLLAFRSVSNFVADHYGVIHQSPQILIIKNGKAVFNTSHHMISVDILRQNL